MRTKRDYPKNVIAIYDLGPEAIDRYAVYYTRRFMPANTGMHSCLSMSARPFHPQGFGQHCEGQLGKHNGRRINFADLPADCRRCVLHDLG